MFDPYHKWLGIPADQRPPTHYQLLGISPTEQDKEVIREAGIRQTNHLRAYQAGPNAQTCAKLLNEIAQAQIVLSDPVKRKNYDAKLGLTAKKAAPAAVATTTRTANPAVLRPTTTTKSKARPRKKSGRGLLIVGLLVLFLGGGAVVVWQLAPNLFGLNSVAVVTPTTAAPATQPPSKPVETSAGEARPEPTKPLPETRPVQETKPLPETRPEPKATPDAKGIARTESARSDEPKADSKPALARGESAGSIRGAILKAAGKMPRPSAEAQAKDEKLLRELYKADYAKTKAPERQAFAAKLLEQGLATKDNPTSRFVLLREATSMAAQGGDASTVVKAVEELEKEFDVVGLDMKIAGLANLAKGVTPATVTKDQLDTLLQVADQAVAADKYDAALAVLKDADAVARKFKNGAAMAAPVQSRLAEVGQLRKEHDQYVKAQAVLKANPADAEANLAVGRFLCINKGEWELGLPHLAAGSDAALRDLATEDLGFPTDAAKRAALGEKWWDAGADTSVAKRRFQERAVYWYEGAVGALTGLTKSAVEKRLAGLANKTANPPTTLVFAALKDLKEIADPVSAEFWSIKQGELGGKLTGSKDSFLWLTPPLGDPFWVRLAFTSGGTSEALAFAPTASLDAGGAWLLEATPEGRLKLHLYKGPVLGPKRSYPLSPGRHVLSAHYAGDELHVFLDGKEQFVDRLEPETPQPLRLGLYTASGETAIEGLSFGSGKPATVRPTTATPVVKLDPTRVAEIFEDKKDFVDIVAKAQGSGVVTADGKDRYSGALSLRISASPGAAMNRWQINSPTWNFKIVEKPSKPGEFRFIRFAWKKLGGTTIALQLLNEAGNQPRFAYFAGATPPPPLGNAGYLLYKTGDLPRNWNVVTRDLYADNKGPFMLNMLAFSPFDGEAGLFDHIYLGRSIEDLDRIPVGAPPR